MQPIIQDVMTGTCFGCGSQNEHGLQIKSTWDGSVATCVWTPKPYHTGGPDWVYGGLIASLMDCHCAAAAMYTAYEAAGRAVDSAPRLYYLTAWLKVEYLRPTPIGKPLTLIAKVDKMEGRKAELSCSLTVDEVECARCTSLFIQPSAYPKT